jgi:hypothetical protein
MRKMAACGAVRRARIGPMLRKSLVFALVVVLVACGEARDDAPPELTEEVMADLSARAVAIACEQQCIGNEVPIRDLVYEQAEATPLVGPPLSDAQRLAMTQQFTDVVFLSDGEANEMVASDGVVVAIGPFTEIEAGTVQTEVMAQGSDSQTIYQIRYQWSGGDWVPIAG